MKHPADLQYRQLIDEHKLERAMTGARAPPAAEFGTMTIRSMADSLFVVPGAETLVSARLSVPNPRGLQLDQSTGTFMGPSSLLLPQYVLHTQLTPRLGGIGRSESVPVLWSSCMQHDAHTTLFALARESEGSEFAWVVARRACARSTLYVANDEGMRATGEKEVSAVIVREPFAGAPFASVDIVLPMPRADGKVVGVPVKRRADELLAQYEAGNKTNLVVLTGQLKCDSRSMEAKLSLPSRTGSGGKDAYLMYVRQSAGGADMELRYRDKITPVQAMHVVLALSRWWSLRHPTRN
jgi:hypothetical protein